MITPPTILASVGPQVRPQKVTPPGDASGDAFLAVLALLAGGPQVPVATALVVATAGEVVPASTTVATATALTTTFNPSGPQPSGPTPAVVPLSPVRPESAAPADRSDDPEAAVKAVVQRAAVSPDGATQDVRLPPDVAVADPTAGVMTGDIDSSRSAHAIPSAVENRTAAVRQVLGGSAGETIAPEQAGGGESQPATLPAKPGRAKPVSSGTAQPAQVGRRDGPAIEGASATPMDVADAPKAVSESLQKARTGLPPSATESTSDATPTVAAPLDLPASPAVPGAAPVPVDRPATAAPSDAALAPAAQIAPHVLRAVADGRRSLTVQLHPAEMGGVEITVETRRDGDLRAHLTVDRPEALRQLREDAPRLVEQLRQAGLELGQGSLSFDLRRDGGQPGFDRRADHSADQPGRLDPPPPADAPARQRAHAATSLLDVLV